LRSWRCGISKGNRKKEGIVSLIFALAIIGRLPMFALHLASAPTDDETRRIIAKAIEAHGGRPT
jgi:hypothetical protein